MNVASQIATENKLAANDLKWKKYETKEVEEVERSKNKGGFEMSFWQCPASSNAGTQNQES